jgi:hypothetical protein
MVVSSGRGGDGGGRVVESADRHVLRHPPPRPVQRRQHTLRHQVGGDEDCVHVGRTRQQPFGARLTAGPAVVAGDDQPLVGLDTRLGEHLPVPGEPLHPARGVQRAGHHADPPPAQRQQVPHHVAGAVPVVGGHVTHLRPQPDRLAARDERHTRRAQFLGHRVTGVAGDQQHPVDVPGGDVPRDAPPFVVRAGQHQQQRDVVRGQGLGAAAQQDVEVRVLEEPLLRLREQEPHRVRTAGDQRAGVPVDDVARLADGRVDRLRGGRTDVVAAVEHP